MKGSSGDLLLLSVLLDDGCLKRLLLQDECCECEILLGLKSEDGCTCRIGLFLFPIHIHGSVRKLKFDNQLVTMLLEMKHGEVNNVGFFATL